MKRGKEIQNWKLGLVGLGDFRYLEEDIRVFGVWYVGKKKQEVVGQGIRKKWQRAIIDFI